jgi:hypothetical protein
VSRVKYDIFTNLDLAWAAGGRGVYNQEEGGSKTISAFLSPDLGRLGPLPKSKTITKKSVLSVKIEEKNI